MNALARAKIDQLKYRSDVFKLTLAHFGNLDDLRATEAVAAAVDYAYTDDLLFEEFEIWTEEKNDHALLFQIEHFMNRKDQAPLPADKRDLTGKTEAIERIKKSAEEDAGSTFAKKLRELANKKGLDTNEKLGKFLSVSAERARILLEGKHKPQMKTLLSVSEHFKVRVDDLM